MHSDRHRRTAQNKVYDGTSIASVTLSDNRVTRDVFTDADSSANFADKNVGDGKTVTVAGISISGTDAGDYVLASTSASTTADITPRTLTVTATAQDKVYDGNTTATVTLTDNRVAGDVFTDADSTADFADKNVGNGKTVSITGISITGTDANNYVLASTSATTTADITPLTLTVTATAQDKVYDGTNNAAVTLTDNRVEGDVFTDADTSASFADKNVGNGKTVTVAGLSITGTDAGNYVLASTSATTTADITPRTLTVTATGTRTRSMTAPPPPRSRSPTTASQATSFTDTDTAANFADKNVANGKTVTISGISITGTDAGNYVLQHLRPRPPTSLRVNTHRQRHRPRNKVYDGTTTATATLADNRVAGDVLTDSDTSASFADKNVGTGKTVSVGGISVSGTDAGNYTATNTTATTTANITPLALTVTAGGQDKVYDGTTTATVTLTDNRVTGDSFTDSYTSASYADKNVANGKTVSVSGISISGIDAANYTFNTTASTTANITPLALTVTATGVNKVYDGTTAATVTLSDNRVAGDVFSDTDSSANFANKNVGTAKAVSVSGIAITGTDAANYTLASTTATTTASITPLTLTVTATGQNKVYDGTTTATVTLTDDRVAGDVFTDTDTAASFADKNVGTGKTVTVTGISITGTDAGNYVWQHHRHDHRQHHAPCADRHRQWRQQGLRRNHHRHGHPVGQPGRGRRPHRFLHLRQLRRQERRQWQDRHRRRHLHLRHRCRQLHPGKHHGHHHRQHHAARPHRHRDGY